MTETKMEHIYYKKQKNTKNTPTCISKFVICLQ